MRTLVLCLLITLSTCPAFSQTDSTAILQAQILDVDSKAALPYATIVLRRQGQLPQVHVTDLHGRIALADLRPGNVSVQARQHNYTPADTSLILQSGLIAIVKLAISAKPIPLIEEAWSNYCGQRL